MRATSNELQIVKLIAVKSVEENNPGVLSPILISNANIAALGTKSDYEFLKKRASYLFDSFPDSIKNLATITQFPGNWMRFTVFVSVVIGILSNYLGPSKLIHVIYNPLTILLIWNFFIYLLLIVKSFLNIGFPSIDKPLKAFTKTSPDEKDEAETVEKRNNKNTKSSNSFLLDWIIGRIFKIIISYKTRLSDETTKHAHIKNILQDFWVSYKEVSGTALILRFKSLLNVSAASLLFGALIGVYFRGLLFNYNIIWQSTFITDINTIRLILNTILGPASLIIDGHLLTHETIALLLSPEGTSAAPWIHKFALNTMLFIFIPRTLMAIFYAKIANRKIKQVDIKQKYYSLILKNNRENLIDVIREKLYEIITKKINKLSVTTSEFVIQDYYEKIIAPILISYREKGGKIRKLESDLFESQEEFEPILSGYLMIVEKDFRESILTEINLFLGQKLDIEISTLSDNQAQSDNIDQKLSNTIAEDIGDALGGTIVTGVAVAAGTISGGLGKSLGIAIISGLLGVSGPIGLLIGSLITVVALGGIYKIRRDQISGMIKDINLPAIVVKMALTDAKIEKAREDTYTHTQNEIKRILEPKIKEVTNGILKIIAY